jgi:hypothetical protein
VPPELGAGSGPPDGARVVHHGVNELLVRQDSVPGEEFTPPVQEGIHQTHPLGSSPADLIDERRPGESFVWGHP